MAVSERTPLLEVEDLRVTFATERGTIHAVDGVSFDVRPGETIGIVGESGCGKSVTSLALLGLLPRAGGVTGGKATFDGDGLCSSSPSASCDPSAGGEIAMIFQDPMTSLNPVLTIGKQIREALQTHLGMSRKEANDRATALLDQVGIPSPATASATTPTSSRAGCGSAR